MKNKRMYFFILPVFLFATCSLNPDTVVYKLGTYKMKGTHSCLSLVLFSDNLLTMPSIVNYCRHYKGVNFET